MYSSSSVMTMSTGPDGRPQVSFCLLMIYYRVFFYQIQCVVLWIYYALVFFRNYYRTT